MPLDLTGETFGRLTVLKPEFAGLIAHDDYYLCQCECGNSTFVRTVNLVYGGTKSCGCLADESRGLNSLKHGQARKGRYTPTYRSWSGAKDRCNNPNSARYADYGGRGIEMCAGWAESFDAFYKDMGDCPPGHLIDRIDVNNGYFPDNCRWASSMEQARHRRDNVSVVWKGETMILRDLAERLGLSYTDLHRFHRGKRNLPIEQAVAEMGRRKAYRLHVWKGQDMRLSDIAALESVPRHMLRYYVRQVGLPLSEAVAKAAESKVRIEKRGTP
jgi:hypothetical protein